ncbi:DUF547 domain-containing protein [Verrucomicrobia bacterium]|nr:DUF547 domain-containing protein [Verrucomicrobiota bacterium]MDA7622883.1 DUF547 domain-containing protein [Verrucomicrobiota bacterium]MDA7627924.1 DUF547 domain-containing protein [Verrucomicrobiota bacterium]
MQLKTEKNKDRIYRHWIPLKAQSPIIDPLIHYRLTSIIVRWVLVMLALAVTQIWAFDSSHALWNKTLKRHVKDGLVDYKGLKRNSIDLEIYLKSISQSPRSEFDLWSSDEQLAFLINLYNAATIQLIVDAYPVKSIKDIGFLPHAAWRQKRIHLWEEKISLNHLEHDIILPRARHLPAIHFALVCAAKGCPQLRSEAYTGSLLKTQLEHQGQVFLRNTSKNRISKLEQVLYLSPIFEWYAEDFERVSGSVKNYLTKHAAHIFQTNLSRYKIHYTRYDWSLNVSEE